MTTPAFAAPLQLPSETLPNRLAKAAMTEGMSDPQGRPSDDLVRLYEKWGRGGAGLLISGNVPVDAHHLERPGNVIIAGVQDDAAKAALRRLAQAARSGGAGFWVQLSHAGRQTPALVNPTPKAPSAVPLALPGKLYGVPVALTGVEIRAIIQAFADAAAVCREAGCTGVQIHGAHGYLISQFLSPLANKREDEWGGSLENRARLLLEIVRTTRAAVGRDFTLAVKLNSADFQRGGFAPGESMQVAQWLEAEGVDLLEVSGGNYEQPRMMKMEGLEAADLSGLPPSTAAREAYFLDFAVELRKQVKTPLMVTGGMRSAAAMNEAIERDGVALIGIGRPMVVDPDAPQRLLEGAASLDRYEERLRLGPGFFSPRSSSKTMRALNGFGALYWQYQQLRRIGRGQAADMRLGLLKALMAERREQEAWMARRGGGV
ncbi:MAG: NADH:flavin oxidoreductase/NADH oxidase family protein [Hyphomonadaceae bacterium]|nr:NADH:flavin oxidoreductase/NADH oxidase family protein [Hyphomonadaceae bacterium]